MEDAKVGILPLVGRAIKQRLSEVKEEASREIGDGLKEFAEELRDDAAPEAVPPTRIEVEER